MTKFYRDSNGRYKGAFGPGVKVPEELIEVATPPQHAKYFTYINNEWVEDSDRAERELEKKVKRTLETTDKDKLIFSLFLDMENRIRTLEGKPNINTSQHRNTLKNKLAAL